MRGVDATNLLGSYLPLSGGKLNGNLSFSKEKNIIFDHSDATGGYTSALIAKSLHSQQQILGYFGANQSNINFVFIGGTWENPNVMFHENGNVALGLSDRFQVPKRKLHVVGDIYCTGKIITDGGIQNNAVSQSSDSQSIGGGWNREGLSILPLCGGRRAA